MYCNILDHNTLALQAVRIKQNLLKLSMTHLFKQMYLEDITDIEKQFTPGELTTAITIELMKRKIDELQRQKEVPISTTKINQLFSWWNYSNEAKKQIGTTVNVEINLVSIQNYPLQRPNSKVSRHL